MNFLVIGLGSMGKRRVRCLQTLGHKNIVGFDLRNDRCAEAKQKYSIETYTDWNRLLLEQKPSAFVISVPPDIHHHYMKIALQQHVHFFVEASVVDTDLAEIIHQHKKLQIVAAPSLTTMFHPAIPIIQQLLKEERLGKISNIIHHNGQFLPDWHTYESVKDFFVSKREVGGGRETASVGLSWLTQLWGFPQRVCSMFRKTIHIEGAETIDDTYNCLLDYRDFLMTLVFDVVSRHPIRRLLVNGDKSQLLWDWNMNTLQLFDPQKAEWEHISYERPKAEEGYLSYIGEQMYVDELHQFIEATQQRENFINTLERDHKVLKLLLALEESDRTSHYIEFEK